ncbi:hypothetical protein BC567DRAFT_220428 [Phyllosticta citribraziliensis]
MCLRKPLRACIPPSPSFLSFPLRQPARRARGLIESNQRQRRCFDSLAPSIPHICLTPTALAQKNKVAHLTSPFSHCCTEGAGMSTCHPEQIRGREIRGTHRRPFPKRGAQGCETRRRASQPCAMYVRYSMMKGKGGGPINQGISQQHRSSPVQSDSGRRTAENTARQEGRGHR